MGAYATRLTVREQVAEGTMAFHLDKPLGFDFKPGQYIDLILIDPPETDSEGNIRTFSLASPPCQPDLVVATRMRDTAFKRVLKTAPMGTRLEFDGPMGSFTLHKNASRPAMFLAGGIGITPFLSILKQAAKDRLGHQLYLFYANRRPEDAAFLDELSQLAASYPNFHFIPSMSEMGKSQRPWKGETGFINREMLTRSLPQLTGPVYYIAGPPAMVAAMRQMLSAAGVDEDDVRTEEFGGY